MHHHTSHVQTLIRATAVTLPTVWTGVMGVAVLGGASALTALPADPAQAQSQRGQPAPLATLSGHRDAALEEVRAAFTSDDPVLRVHALEAVQHAPDVALPLATLGLGDDAFAVRFSALKTTGKLQLQGLAGALREAVRPDEASPAQEHVLGAVSYAAKRLGVASDRMVSVLGALTQHESPRVRANAVLLLGELGNPTAVQMIRRSTIRPASDMNPGGQWRLLNVQAAEALVKLGDPRGLESLRKSAYSSHDEVRVFAIQALGRLGDESFWSNLNNFLVENPVEFRLAAAEGLARLGKDRGGMLQVMAQGATHRLDTVRAQSAFALGPYDHDLARGYLVRLLSDPEPKVRIAAAAAILEATAASVR